MSDQEMAMLYWLPGNVHRRSAKVLLFPADGPLPPEIKDLSIEDKAFIVALKTLVQMEDLRDSLANDEVGFLREAAMEKAINQYARGLDLLGDQFVAAAVAHKIARGDYELDE